MAVSEAKSVFLYIGLFLLLSVSACKDDKEAEIPAYLSIPEITLSTDNSTQGSAAHGITDAWVLVDGKVEGVFGLPVNIPLLYEGQHNVEVYAGVRRNGSASYHIIYPMYKGYSSTVNFVAGETVTLHPTTTYTTSCNFPWMEDFEDQSTSLVPTALNNVDSLALKITNDPQYVFSPGASSSYTARINWGSEVGLFEVASKDLYELPQNGSETYIELNIKTNIDTDIGIYASNTSQFLRIRQLLIYPTNGEWKKFYISLKESLGAQPQGMKFKVFVSAINTNSNFTPEILIDNLKLVYLE